jgi:succinate-semialdehyde dehydrogenase/glutarate-semialdehyde dehydrogenase
MAIASIDPATGQVLETFTELDESELDERVGRAASAFARYRGTSLEQRTRLLMRAAELLEAEAVALAGEMTQEMGKPIGAAIAEVKKCARACRYYAAHGPGHLADEIVATEAETSFVRTLPLGPVLAIMPWNFPFWQVFRFAAPALMAGNVVLLKHASNVPRCARAIEHLLRRSGFDDGVFQTLLVGSDRVRRVIDDPRVRGVTLTGSVAAGRAVAERAGARLKKTVLELGGSDPFIVMPSASLDEATRAAVDSRTVNSGQSCIAAKRFIVHRKVYAAFEEGFLRRTRELRIGDPMEHETQIGPLASAEVLAQVERQVRESVAAGARLRLGGHRLDRRGFYYAPTVLVDVPRGAPAYGEEVFGPVAALFQVTDLDEAITLANATRFGLGSAVWTENEVEIERFTNELEAGLTFVNSTVASDPRLPFGGVKESGYGRELSREGIREFVNVKTVYVKRSSSSASRQERA